MLKTVKEKNGSRIMKQMGMTENNFDCKYLATSFKRPSFAAMVILQ
jgi:hypothetical protein